MQRQRYCSFDHLKGISDFGQMGKTGIQTQSVFGHPEAKNALRTRINEAFKKQKLTPNVFGLSGTCQKASKNSTNQECPRRIQARAKESPR